MGRSLAAVDFASVPPDVRQECLDIFRGFGQTKTVENAFKVLREAEKTKTSNKTMARPRRWATLVTSQLLADAGRCPLQIPMQGQKLPGKYPHRIHEATRAQDPGQAVPIKDILKRQTWESLSPAQSRGLCGELAFLQHWHERGSNEMWAKESWLVPFLVFGEVYKHKNRYWLCLGTLGGKFASLVWPLTAASHNSSNSWTTHGMPEHPSRFPCPAAAAPLGNTPARPAGSSSSSSSSSSQGASGPVVSTSVLFWILSSHCVDQREAEWVLASDVEGVTAYPSTVLSPAGQLHQGLNTGSYKGVVLVQALRLVPAWLLRFSNPSSWRGRFAQQWLCCSCAPAQGPTSACPMFFHFARGRGALQCPGALCKKGLPRCASLELHLPHAESRSATPRGSQGSRQHF